MSSTPCGTPIGNGWTQVKFHCSDPYMSRTSSWPSLEKFGVGKDIPLSVLEIIVNSQWGQGLSCDRVWNMTGFFLNYRPTWASLNISEGRIIQLRADCPGPRSAPDSCAGIEYGTTLSCLTVMRAFCADCQVIESEDEERDAERDSSYDSVSQLPLRCFYCDQRFQYRWAASGAGDWFALTRLYWYCICPPVNYTYATSSIAGRCDRGQRLMGNLLLSKILI